MKRSYSDLDQHTGDPPFAFGPAARGPRQPKQYQQQTEPGTGKIKACMQCGTTRTPQWREGPYGPKTLCNACGVKRVRAIKAQQQGKNPTQVPHTSSAGTKKKSAAAARTQESIELATTLQLLAGNLDAGPPPAKRQARAGQVGPGRGRKANSMQAAANHVPEYDPFDPAAAAAMSAPALGSAVQKAIAAIAAKGSMGGESNPTDSGEEISWSPNDHTAPGDAAAAAAGEGAGSRRQRQQQQQLRAAMAAAAAAQLAAAGAGDQEDLMQLPGLQGQPLSQQIEAGLAEGYGGDTAEPGHDGAGAAGDEEAAAVANLLSMSAAASEQQQNSGPRPTSSAGKAAMREFVAQLAAGSGPSATPASRSPARRQSTRTPPPRHVVTVRQRGAAAAAEPLVEEDVLYLLGPGMAVMARYVAPEELLEVIKLNEMASEAQRSKAAAEAAVEAVEQILRDKQAAALAAQATARTAMQRLHTYVGELNAEHSLMLKAAQEQQPAALASRLAGSSAVGSLTQLDILAASLQQQQQMQDMQAEAGAELADQQQQHEMIEQEPDQEDSLAGLAAAAAAAAAAEEPEVMNGPVKAEPEGAEGVVGTAELVVDPLVLGEGVGAGAESADACVDAAGATGAVVDAAATLAAPAVDAASLAAAVAAEPVEALPQQPQAGVFAAQPELQANELQQLHAAAAAAAAALPVAFQATEAAAAAAAQMPTAEDVSMQDAQLLGSLQELAVLAGIFDNNNGVAAVGSSPALI